MTCNSYRSLSAFLTVLRAASGRLSDAPAHARTLAAEFQQGVVPTSPWKGFQGPRYLSSSSQTFQVSAERAAPASSQPATDAGGEPRHVSQHRLALAHFLKECAGSDPQALQNGMKEMTRYLELAKNELQRFQKANMVLDKHIVDNYIECEDLYLTACLRQSDREGLKSILGRLSLILQNQHHLLVPMPQPVFDRLTENLFRRFFRVCYAAGDVERAQRAWNSLRTVNFHRVLHDVEISVLYAKTLLLQRMDTPAAGASMMDDAMKELEKLLGPGSLGESGAGVPGVEKPASDSAGQPAAADNDQPKVSAGKAAHTRRGFRDSERLQLAVGFKELLAICTLYIRQDRLRIALRAVHGLRNVRPQNWLTDRRFNYHMGEFNVYKVLALSAKAGILHQAREEPTVVTDLVRFAVEDVEHFRAKSSFSGTQGMDEGLVQEVLHMLSHYGDSELALRLVDVFSAQLNTLPCASPDRDVERDTVVGKHRVPQPATYHALLNVCCADHRQGAERRALECLGRLETNLAAVSQPRGPSGCGHDALEPTRVLADVAERLGNSIETWELSWKALEAIDRDNGLLTPSQLHVLITALSKLPHGAAFEASKGSGDTAGQAPTVESDETPGDAGSDGFVVDSQQIITKAVALHDMVKKGFDNAVSVQTYNAVLSVFCRADIKEASMRLILNLLEMMGEEGVKKSEETYLLLLQKWAASGAYSAFLATVEDMESENLKIPESPVQEALRGVRRDGRQDLIEVFEGLLPLSSRQHWNQGSRRRHGERGGYGDRDRGSHDRGSSNHGYSDRGRLEEFPQRRGRRYFGSSAPPAPAGHV